MKKYSKSLLACTLLLATALLAGCASGTGPIDERNPKVAAAKAKYLEQLADQAQMDAGTGFVAMPPRSISTEDGEGYFYLYYSDIPTIIGHISREKNVSITDPQPQTIGLESDNRLTGFFFHYESN